MNGHGPSAFEILGGRWTAPGWMRPLFRWDALTVGLGAHGVALFLLDEMTRPALGAGIVAGFVAWRAAMRFWRLRTRDPLSAHRIEMIRAVGSLLLAAGLVASDGGTESPVFFWPLIILAWNALVHSVDDFGILIAVTLATYIAVVALVRDYTATSMARFGLLVIFCGVLQVGILRLRTQGRHSAELTRLLREVLDRAPVGLAVADEETGEVAFANEDFTGLGLNDDEVRDAAARAHLAQVGGEALVLDRPEPDGTIRHIRVIAGTPEVRTTATVILTTEDVTDRVEMHEERRRFLQMLNHQLRTPLTPIMAYSELLAAGELERAEAERAVAEIIGAARRLNRLFTRMASIVQVQEERHHMLAPSKMAAVLRALRAIEPSIVEGVDVEGDPEIQVLTHEPTAATALFELLDNGRKYGVAPRRLAWSEEHGEVTITVSDCGSGPASTDPFTPWGNGADPGTDPDAGTALGLPHAHVLVSLLGGELTLERDQGRCTFLMRLPQPI